MRLLIVGSGELHSLESIYLHYLSYSLEEVSLFNIKEYVSYNSLITRIRNRLYDRSIFLRANEALLEHVRSYSPTIVWIFKGVEVSIKTLRTIKELGVKIVNYNPDHPFIRTSVAHGGKEIEESVSWYDLHFCYSRMLMKRIQNDFNIRCEYLPFGYHLDVMDYDNVQQIEEEIRVCFVGNPDKSRANCIKTFRDNNINVDVFGNGWKRHLKETSQIRIYPAVYGQEYWRLLRKYRVQLNIFRPHNIDSHNMRTFEIPSVSGIQLAPDSSEHRKFFNSGYEIFLYRSDREMIDKAKWLLSLSKEQIDVFRRAARKRCIIDDYSYKERAEIVKNRLMQL